MADSAAIPSLPRPPRRVLFFGKNMSRSRATGGLVEALRAHELDVKWVNIATVRRWIGRDNAIRYTRRLFAKFAPDLVFVFCRDLPFSLLKEFSAATTTVVWVEEPLENIADDYVEYLAQADAVFVTNPSKLGWLHARGVPHAAFVLEGFSPTFHHPVRPTGALRDIVFIGGPGREGRRAEFLSDLASRHDLEIYGCHWDEWATLYPNLKIRGPVRPRGFRKLCATSRIVLGLNQVNGDHLYFSNRTFLTLACRGFHLTHYVPGLERVFRDREHLVWYHNRDECLTLIDEFLADDDERRRIAQQGCDYVHAVHRFDSRIQFILHALRAGVAAPPSWLPFDERPGYSAAAATASASE